jgi:hypothetical protein
MAFNKDNFQAVGGQSKAGNAPQMWSYSTTDLATEVRASGYFNTVSSIVKKGDLIYCHGDTDGTAFYTLYPVVSNASGVVDVSDGTALSTTDTD